MKTDFDSIASNVADTHAIGIPVWQIVETTLAEQLGDDETFNELRDFISQEIHLMVQSDLLPDNRNHRGAQLFFRHLQLALPVCRMYGRADSNGEPQLATQSVQATGNPIALRNA